MILNMSYQSYEKLIVLFKNEIGSKKSHSSEVQDQPKLKAQFKV